MNLYIEYAELQALERKPMTMRDWITKLDDFLKISGRQLLDHAGKISADDARAKAELEYTRYRALLDAQPQRVDADFEKAAKRLKMTHAEQEHVKELDETGPSLPAAQCFPSDLMYALRISATCKQKRYILSTFLNRVKISGLF